MRAKDINQPELSDELSDLIMCEPNVGAVMLLELSNSVNGFVRVYQSIHQAFSHFYISNI